MADGSKNAVESPVRRRLRAIRLMEWFMFFMAGYLILAGIAVSVVISIWWDDPFFNERWLLWFTMAGAGILAASNAIALAVFLRRGNKRLERELREAEISESEPTNAP